MSLGITGWWPHRCLPSQYFIILPRLLTVNFERYDTQYQAKTTGIKCRAANSVKQPTWSKVWQLVYPWELQIRFFSDSVKSSAIPWCTRTAQGRGILSAQLCLVAKVYSLNWRENCYANQTRLMPSSSRCVESLVKMNSIEVWIFSGYLCCLNPL